MENQAPGLIGLIPYIIIAIPMALMCRHLAEEKGRSANFYTVLGIIPLVNFFSFAFLIGLTSLLLDKKLDTIIALLERNEKEG